MATAPESQRAEGAQGRRNFGVKAFRPDDPRTPKGAGRSRSVLRYAAIDDKQPVAPAGGDEDEGVTMPSANYCLAASCPFPRFRRDDAVRASKR